MLELFNIPITMLPQVKDNAASFAMCPCGFIAPIDVLRIVSVFERIDVVSANVKSPDERCFVVPGHAAGVTAAFC